jgi:hypothetical protein
MPLSFKQKRKKLLYTKAFDIVVNPVASGFAKALQRALRERVNNKIYRRLSPKTVPARRTIISRRGNVLRPGSAAFVRPFFSVTQSILNKVAQFDNFARNNISCPRHATDVVGAKGIECKTLFARQLINSTNGRGIVEFESNSPEYPRAPLYTEYIPKKAEYRFHVFNGEVIDIQQKKKKREFEHERDTRIRNLNNGYIYCRDGVVPPDGAANLAIRAVEACGYTYGAVDIIYNEKRDQSFVLEVNSRPGLMGTTLAKYADAIIKAFDLDVKT